MNKDRNKKVPPPHKRLCQKHGKPIIPSLWRNRYRTSGCLDCLRERKEFLRANTIVPTAAKRICKKHGRPICPSRWKCGDRSSGCALCNTIWRTSPKSRKKRAEKWTNEFISCTRHPSRRCNRGQYVWNGKRRCGSCSIRRSNGTFRPSTIRNINKIAYRKLMEKRRHLGGRLRGIELFTRSTGLDLKALGLAGG